MLVKAKDVVCDGGGRGRAHKFSHASQPHSASRTRATRGLRARACDISPNSKIFAAVQEINNTPRSMAGRAQKGEHHENSELL